MAVLIPPNTANRDRAEERFCSARAVVSHPRPPGRPTTRSSVAVLVIVAVGLSGCPQTGDGSGGRLSSPVVASSAPATMVAQMAQYLRDADRANVRTDNTLVLATARPTVTVQNSELIPMLIRDEGKDRWKAGNYRLVVYCVGTGTVVARLGLGAQSAVSELPTCTPTVTTGIVELTLPDPATNSSVLIIPAGNAQAAIAYQIQKFQG